MAAPPASKLDGLQVLQHSFDDANGRIRVDADITLDTAALEIIISHEDDSIRIGDGVSLVTTTTNSGKVGLDVNISGSSITLPVTFPALATPTIVFLNMPVADTEYSVVLPASVKTFKFRSKNKSRVQYSYQAGTTGTLFFTVMPGNIEQVSDLGFSSPTSVYFRASRTDVLEILYWT